MLNTFLEVMIEGAMIEVGKEGVQLLQSSTLSFKEKGMRLVKSPWFMLMLWLNMVELMGYEEQWAKAVVVFIWGIGYGFSVTTSTTKQKVRKKKKGRKRAKK